MTPDIWLPNTIVTGVEGNIAAPVELLRQTQDVWTLWLLVELYRAHHLPSDGGIHWRCIRRSYERTEVARLGQHTVWGFSDEGTDAVFPDAPFALRLETQRCARHDGRRWPENRELPSCCEEARTESLASRFWPRLRRLEALGLVGFVDHVVEADTRQAEVIHPYGSDGGLADRAEIEMASEAHRAAAALLRYEFQEQKGEGLRLVLLPAHMKEVQLFGLVRLRYKPLTGATLEWHSQMTAGVESLCAQYREIATGTRSTLHVAPSVLTRT